MKGERHVSIFIVIAIRLTGSNLRAFVGFVTDTHLNHLPILDLLLVWELVCLTDKLSFFQPYSALKGTQIRDMLSIMDMWEHRNTLKLTSKAFYEMNQVASIGWRTSCIKVMAKVMFSGWIVCKSRNVALRIFTSGFPHIIICFLTDEEWRVLLIS